MNWDLHNKWAGKLGIDERVSQGVNSLVDDMGDVDLATEFKQRKGEYEATVLDRKDVSKGNSALGAVVALHDDEHDAGRKLTTDSKIYSEIQLEFLNDKGEDHLTAWRLHHTLDFLWENRHSEVTLDTLFQAFRADHPEIHSSSIEEFLRHNRELLIKDLRR